MPRRRARQRRGETRLGDVLTEPGELADAVARRSYGKLIAYLSARTRDVAAAEDALAEAFALALRDWPRTGCPDNPEAWLLTVARRKSIDMDRKRRRDEIAAERMLAVSQNLNPMLMGTEFPDERLGLMFACAHPALDASVRAPLILQTILGLNAKAIASAFLTSPEAMSKRLVRAKEKIRQAGIAIRVPEPNELPERLEAVLDAVYAAYSEGWSDPLGTDAAKRNLADEAIFLARLLAELQPREPEALGLLALMLYAESRRAARRSASGEFVPLAEQDRSLWNARMISDAEGLLFRAQKAKLIGRFQLEAAIQSAHIDRLVSERSNWIDVASLYEALVALTGSPVAEINRALAVSEFEGPAFGLEILNLVGGRVTQYQPYWAARAELLSRTGDYVGAGVALEVAIGLEMDPCIRRFLQSKKVSLLRPPTV